MQLNELKNLVNKPSLINPTTQTHTKWNNDQLKKFVDVITEFMTKNKYVKISYSFNETKKMLECVEISTDINDKSTYSAKNSFKYTLNKRIKKFGMQTHLHTYKKSNYLVFSRIGK